MGFPSLARYVAVQNNHCGTKKEKRQFCVQEQLAHCSELKVMTEKPETDVNKDYITPPTEIYAHETARDAFQLKLQSFQSNHTDSNSLSLFSPCTETARQQMNKYYTHASSLMWLL